MQDPSFVRLGSFLLAFCLLAYWEWRSPRKRLTQNKAVRWVNNMGLIALNSLILTLLMPLLAFEAAQIASSESMGLFHLLDLPMLLEVILSVVILDMVIYLQHLIFHRVPLLWKLHRVHHADQDIDLTTGSRFHPIEIILSLWVKIAFVILLGAPVLSVVIFEIILNVSAMFNHSNALLPLNIDKPMRKIVVTPDMHRVHHSIIVRETHSNFGFFLSIWDRWFGTYRAQPEQGHEGCTIGIPEFRQPREQFLDKMLTQPFR